MVIKSTRKTALIIGILILGLLFSNGCGPNPETKITPAQTSSAPSEVKTPTQAQPPTNSNPPTETPVKVTTPPKTDDGTVHFSSVPLTIDSRDYTLTLRNTPEDVQGINLSLDNSVLNGAKSVYITTDISYDSYAIIAKTEASNVPQILGLPTKYTFTSENDLGYEKKTCSDSSSGVLVIDIRLGSETKIFNEGSCLIIEAKNYGDMIKAADRLTFFWANLSN